MDFTPQITFPEETFLTIDSHTMGEPTRIVLKGFPKLLGTTMMEKKEYLEKHFDHYRTALMLEPRGHKDMFGAVITEPVSKEADLGVIFMDSGGYLNMCGHGTIGTATVAVETGLVPVTEPYTHVVLEAPAGIIHTQVRVKDGKAVEVSLQNVTAFLYKENIEMELEGYPKFQVDIVFGGSFFALINIEQLPLEIGIKDLPAITELGMNIIQRLNDTLEIKHPKLAITKVDLAEFYGPPSNPLANKRNVVIFGNSQVDRSPCGTGTSAKLAYLYAKGEIKLGEEFVYESITGSMFKGVAMAEARVGDYKGITPKVTGSAYITGMNRIVMDRNDPLEYGFLLGKYEPNMVDNYPCE